MSVPAVLVNEIDGALGALPPSAGRPLAVVGACDDGPVNTPALFAGSAGQRAILQTFKAGPAVEAACVALARGVAVAFVRTGASVAGSYPEDDVAVVTGAGTATVTVDDEIPPNDDYEVFVIFRSGTTIADGTATDGAVYQWSLDGGRTLSPPTALGTDDTIVLPGTGGVTIELGDGTVLAGQTISFATKAPQWNASELTAALTTLKDTAINWEIAEIVGDIDSTAFDAIEAEFAAMYAKGKGRYWVGHVRNPEGGEDEATYRGALESAWASKATVVGSLTAGAIDLVSNGRALRRPLSFTFAPDLASASEEIDLADFTRGPIIGASIRDANGNPKHHDEFQSPGLDDLRFVTARTSDDAEGVYYTNPRTFSPAGSDFEFAQHRRVMNLGRSALRAYFVRRLSKPVRVSKKTGFILEEEAREIERGAESMLRSVLLTKPKASGIKCVLSRTDNLLSTYTMTAAGRIIPLAYPKFIELEMSFSNPALQVVEV